MHEPCAFEYAVIRVVPQVERQEFVNVGVLLFCKTLDFLDARIDFDLERLKLLAPDADLSMITNQLNHILTICRGGDAAGFFGGLSKSERFNWLAAPSSTIIQSSPVHSGICEQPREALERLHRLLVVSAPPKTPS
jgi:hypothetical protein